MKKILLMMATAAVVCGCAGKGGSASDTTTKRVLTRSATAESATVRLTEEFTSEIEPYKENDITPAATGVLATASSGSISGQRFRISVRRKDALSIRTPVRLAARLMILEANSSRSSARSCFSCD